MTQKEDVVRMNRQMLDGLFDEIQEAKTREEVEELIQQIKDAVYGFTGAVLSNLKEN